MASSLRMPLFSRALLGLELDPPPTVNLLMSKEDVIWTKFTVSFVSYALVLLSF